MSQTNAPCKVCKKPWDKWNHHVVGFRLDGCPQLKCNGDTQRDPCPFFDGANLLWNRLETAENGDLLAKKTADLSTARTTITRLELANKQLSTEVAKFAETTVAAVAEAVKAAKDGMQADLDKALAQVTFKEGLLAEAEATNASLRAKLDELNADLSASNTRANDAEVRAREAEARAEAAETRVTQQAKAIAALVENDAQTVPVKPDDVIESDDVIDLDQRTKPAVREVQPPRPVAVPPPAPKPAIVTVTASSAPAPAVSVAAPPPPPPAAPASVPAPADAPVAVTCSFCKDRADLVAHEKWELRDGGHVDTLFSCRKKIGSHAETLYEKVLKGMRDDLVNPPDDSIDVPGAFEPITSTPTV